MKVFGFLFLALAFLSACSDQREEPKCPCKVKVQVLQEDGTYHRETVTLQTLDDVQKVRSSNIHVTLNPRFYKDGSISETVPEAQYFVNKDNEIVPKTALSEQMFTLYKIMEDLYMFDKISGVDKILSYPRYISILEPGSGGHLDTGMYTPAFDRIRILNYNGKKAPTAWNPGVIAHEHFHAIFTKIVNPMANTIGMDYEGKAFVQIETADAIDFISGFNFLILKALDEGLADYWGYLHTGQDASYATSFSDVEGRKVLPIIGRMDSQEYLQNELKFHNFVREDILSKGKERPLNAYIYGKGVLYSNLIRSMSESLFPESKTDIQKNKVEIALWIIDSLKKLSATIVEKGTSQYLTQADLLSAFVLGDSPHRSSVCYDINNAFLQHHSAKIPACGQ